MTFLFLTIVLGAPLLTIVWWFWADARLRRLGTSAGRSPGDGVRWSRRILAAFCILFYVGFVWLMLGRMWPESLLALRLPRMPVPWLMAVLMVWAVIVLPAVAAPSMIAWSAWRLGKGFLRRVRSLPPPAESPGDAPSLTRRDLLVGTLTTAPIWATVGLTGWGLVQRRHFRIRELSVEVPALPRALDGLTIAHVSDTHVGKFTRGEILNRIADATNDLAADLVLLTGDLIDYSIYDLPEAVRMVERIDRRSGLFLIEGNHDLFDGREAFVRGVKEAGLPLLSNETATVMLRGQAVQILGLKWHGRDGSLDEQVDAVAAQRDPRAFPILLAHHPHAFDRAAELGMPLVLAGHTHGGQLMLTREFGVGPALFKYWSGLYSHGPNRLVVSNGAGNWFPVRTNAPAEILHITLRAPA